MAALVAVLVLVAFLLGYRFYARYIGQRIYHDGDEITTPAHEFEDGLDYVPTTKHILFGHHFTSIAGAAPIIGPCVAAYWGVVPALLWVVIGVIFMGAVHDFGALVVSIREKGRSIADIAGNVINGRVRLMFLAFVMVLSWLVLAVFAMAIAGMFVKIPSSVVPVNIEIVIAIAMGWLLYKKKMPALLPSLIALGLLYLFVWVGTDNPVNFTVTPEEVANGTAKSLTPFGWSTGQSKTFWLWFLFAYAGIASLLPVWLLLQPRDYINSHQLVVGLGLLFTGLFIAAPAFDAPWFRTESEGAPPIVPILFVTIACGAISGFHGLVSSGTTSKQISHMRDARAIGYGAMLGEGCLALAATMAAVAGLGMAGGGAWAGKYATWASAGTDAATTFVLGGTEFLREVGLDVGLARTLMAVLVVSFAATTLDTATRIQRFIITEIGVTTGIRPLRNRYFATVIALIPAMVLVFWTQGGKSVAWKLWPVFGASNQMLAALTLMVLALYFWQRKRPVLPLVLPMLFVMVITIWAILFKTGQLLDPGVGKEIDWLLLGLNGLLLTLILWMIFEGLLLVRRLRKQRAKR